ncbi:VCBS domain-containing protein, partial [Plebeiibacterium sediminum]
SSLSTSEDTPLTITIDDVTYTDDNYEGSATYSLIIQDGTNYTHEGNTITPIANFNGTLSVVAVVSDGLLSSAPSTITVTVSSVNDAPVITGTSSLSTSEDTPLTITIDDVTYTD